MCIAIPMQVLEVQGSLARCRARGTERNVDLALVGSDEVAEGDWILVHLGRALRTTTAHEAAETWALFDLMDEPLSPTAAR